MAERERREPIFNTPPHLSQHSKEISGKEWFWLEECRKRMSKYNTTRL